MIPDGNDLIIDKIAADYWRALFVFALVLVLWYRLFRPVVNTFRYGMRVTEVIHEGPGVVSLRITGPQPRPAAARRPASSTSGGSSPRASGTRSTRYSLSEAPHGDSFRITVKNLGDHSAKFGQIPIGTRVFAEGPFGVFTDESRTRDKTLLIAGGIGITPVRALLEQMDGDVVALYRVVSDRRHRLLGRARPRSPRSAARR